MEHTFTNEKILRVTEDSNVLPIGMELTLGIGTLNASNEMRKLILTHMGGEHPSIERTDTGYIAGISCLHAGGEVMSLDDVIR